MHCSSFIMPLNTRADQLFPIGGTKRHPVRPTVPVRWPFVSAWSTTLLPSPTTMHPLLVGAVLCLYGYAAMHWLPFMVVLAGGFVISYMVSQQSRAAGRRMAAVAAAHCRSLFLLACPFRCVCACAAARDRVHSRRSPDVDASQVDDGQLVDAVRSAGIRYHHRQCGATHGISSQGTLEKSHTRSAMCRSNVMAETLQMLIVARCSISY